MKRIVKTLGFCIALSMPLSATADTGSADKYPNYYAAVKARESGDCDAVVHYLNAFLHKHSYIQEKYPEFYLDVKLVIGQCKGTIVVRGIGGEPAEMEPLPEHTPMESQ